MVPTELRLEQALNIDEAAQEEFKGNASAACFELSLACAYLTSPVKAEREEGKKMVKQWKYANKGSKETA